MIACLRKSVAETVETKAQMQQMEVKLKEILESLFGFHMSREKTSQTHGEKGSSSRGGTMRDDGFHHFTRSCFIKTDFPIFSHKTDFPIFLNDDHPTEWVSRASQYFDFQKIEKLLSHHFHFIWRGR